MESKLLLQILLAILVTVTWVVWIRKKKSMNGKHNPPPEIPGGRYITGHLHLLKYPMRPHRHFAALAKKYGPIYIIRPGMCKTLVVSDAEIAKECFTTQDLALANRPISFLHKVMGYNRAMFTFSPYGSYWREARKIATTKLLTSQKLDNMKHVRAAEVGVAVKSLRDLWVENGRLPLSIEMNGRLEDLVFNIMMKMIAGRKYLGDEVVEEDESFARAFRRAAKEFNRSIAVTIPYDALPFLGWLDLKGDLKWMKKIHDEMDSVMHRWVDEHRRMRKMGLYDNLACKDDQNFIDALLDMEEEGSLVAVQTDADTVIKATAMNLIIAGVENTTTTLIWMISLLLKNPSALEKAQAEVDAVVGKGRILNESDIANMPYLQAIVKETLRLYPPAALLIPHAAREDCIVSGYHISRGTRLVVNAWMTQRDPSLWSDPEKFYPERFMTTNLDRDIKGQSFEVLPFGAGRRMCPGTLFALQILHLSIANLLHAFDWAVDPVTGVDLEEGYGPSLIKLNPLSIQLKPRLPEELYASM